MMSRTLRVALVAMAVVFAGHAEAAKKKPASEDSAPPAQGKGTPTPLGQFGDWSAFQVGNAKGRSCFTISSPKERKPDKLERDPATFFVTRRPGEGVHNEISLILGFPTKEGGSASLKIGKTAYSLYTKDTNAWVKNAAEEATVIATMKKGSNLIFEGTSKRGNKTTDRYSLTGLPQALDTITKACP